MKEKEPKHKSTESKLPLPPIEELKKRVSDLADENNLSISKRLSLHEYANLSFRSRLLISDFIYFEKPAMHYELASDENGKKNHFQVTKKVFEKSLLATITRKLGEFDKEFKKSKKLKKLKPKVQKFVDEISPLPVLQ